MTYIKSYKDLIVWQRGMELAREVFELTKFFPKSELYGLVSQMRRCGVSIVSNIAEGYGRKSRNEYRQFLNVAYGSALELETQIILSKSLNLSREDKFRKSEDLLLEVLKMLNYLTNKLDAKR